TEDRVAGKIQELLEARTVQFFQHEGQVLTSPERADNPTQARMTELAASLYAPAGETASAGPTVQVMLLFPPGIDATDTTPTETTEGLDSIDVPCAEPTDDTE